MNKTITKYTIVVSHKAAEIVEIEVKDNVINDGSTSGVYSVVGANNKTRKSFIPITECFNTKMEAAVGYLQHTLKIQKDSIDKIRDMLSDLNMLLDTYTLTHTHTSNVLSDLNMLMNDLTEFTKPITFIDDNSKQ